MIAKINLDGKSHLAVVFNEWFSYDELAEIRSGLTNILGFFDAMYEESGLQNERAAAHQLLDELSPSVDQTFDMMDNYFGDNKKKAEKKNCEVYI